jgi:hypothetical protein
MPEIRASIARLHLLCLICSRNSGTIVDRSGENPPCTNVADHIVDAGNPDHVVDRRATLTTMTDPCLQHDGGPSASRLLAIVPEALGA